MSLRKLASLLTVGGLLAALVLASGCSQKPALDQPILAAVKVNGEYPVNGIVQQSAEGPVTLALEWRGESSGMLMFDVAINTHSVDLDSYDLSQLTLLRDDQGKEYRPVSWAGEGSGHHRSGSLGFPMPDTLKDGRAKYIMIIAKGIGGIDERILEWELKNQG